MKIELLFVLVFGLCFGSFVNVLIYRIPRNFSILYPSSHCPHCQTPLKWRDKIPFFSYLVSRAKCRYCHIRIPLFYPLSECLGAVFALFCYMLFPLPCALFLFLFLLLFYALSVIDVQFLAIPDSLNFLAFFFALCFAFFWDSVLNAGIAAFCFIGFAAFLRLFVGSILQKEVLGEGDLILFGAIGCVLGALFGAIAIFLSAIYALLFYGIALIFKRPLVAIPFAPFLFLGFLSTFVWRIHNLQML